LKALISAAKEFCGPGFLLPTRNGELFRWCLGDGLRVTPTDDLDEPRSVQRSRSAHSSRRFFIEESGPLTRATMAARLSGFSFSFQFSAFPHRSNSPALPSSPSTPRTQASHLQRSRLDFFEEWRIGAQGREFLEEQREIALLAENG
jgi:hypothetical protein